MSKINTIEEQTASEPESAGDSADDSASDNSLVQQINQIKDDIHGIDQDLEINRIHKKYKQNNSNSYKNNSNAGEKVKPGIIILGQPLQIFNMKNEQYSNQVMMALQFTNGILMEKANMKC